MNSKHLVLTALATGLLVLAAAGAQLLPQLEPECELEAPFSCERFSVTGGVLAIDLVGPAAEDVRVIVNGPDCETADAFFEDFSGAQQAEFSCGDLRPGDRAYLSILYDDAGERSARSGKVIVG